MTQHRFIAYRLASVGLGMVAACLISTAVSGQVYPAGHVTPAARYFARAGEHSSVVQAVYPAAVPQQIQSTGAKPFKEMQLPSPISPYLSLDLPETTTSLPNFYAYVQPQQQQRARLEQQAQELRRLQQQRLATAPRVISKNPTAGMPTTGGSNQFMNLGGYYQTNTVR